MGLTPRLRVVLGCLVSLVCLWLAFRGVPLSELADHLGHLNYWWLLPALLSQAIQLAARARRWQVLLGRPARFSEVFWALVIGDLGNNVLPMRAGEAARVVLVNRQMGFSAARAATSVVLERLADVVVLTAILFLLLPFVRIPRVAVVAGLALGAVTLCGLLAAGLVLRFGERGTLVTRLIPRWLPGPLATFALKQWAEVRRGLELLGDTAQTRSILGWSVVVWLGVLGIWWAIIEAVVPGASPVEPATAVVATSVGLAVPSTPGFIGVFQLIGQRALVVPFPERYTVSSALTIALVVHAMTYLVTSAAGVVGILRLGISFRDLRGGAPTG